MEKSNSKINFINLHAHTTSGSPFDALGFAPEHMEQAYASNMNALAITEHGNANSVPYQVLHCKKMIKEGKEFKNIYGAELYFVPSVPEWLKEYQKDREERKKLRKSLAEDDSGIVLEDEKELKKANKNFLSRRTHLLLLAKNQEGLSNLFKLISESYKKENFFRYPRIDYEMLRKYGKGLIATSACIGGFYGDIYFKNKKDGPDKILDEMRTATNKIVGIFKDDWYGELQWNNIVEQHELNQYIIQMASEYGFDLLSTADSHYSKLSYWKDREVYKRLGWLGRDDKEKPEWMKTGLPNTIEEVGYKLYVKNGQQMWDDYKEYSSVCKFQYDDELILKSIEDTCQVAYSKIEEFYPDNTVRLPKFVVPLGETEDAALTRLSIAGLKEKELHKNKEYVDRLKEELKVIHSRKFSKYFLTMKMVVDRAKKEMFVGAGRGSGAGSLVSYCLGITQVDPIRWDLLFSRFLRKDAVEYPDIDVDFSRNMDLKQILINEWGESTIIPISNWNTLQLKSLIKDVAKLYKVPFAEVNKVTGRMMAEATPSAKKKNNIISGVYIPTFEEVLEFSTTLQDFLNEYPDVKTHILTLYGNVRSQGRHASGVCIGENLDRSIPIVSSGGVRQSPWTDGQHVRHLEPMGFIKFDLLGLASLRMFEETINLILQRHKNVKNPSFDDIKRFYNFHLHPDVMNFNDQKVYENIFYKGKFVGIFQFTETGAQEFCKRVAPKNLMDISAITAIYRPGPIGAKVHEKYIEAKEHPETVHYINDIVKSVTESTYGYLVFQEQIATLAYKLGKDISLDEGNILQKLLTKKGKDAEEVAEKKQRIHQKFVDGCREKGMSEYDIEKLWGTFEYFSGYGFNKAHAISYSIVSYQCAWLACYYPIEWTASFLDKEPEKKKEKAILLAKQAGFKIAPLNINKSGRIWEIDKDNKTLIQPLTSIKGLGEVAMKQILDNRPFKSIEDFLFNETILLNKGYSKLNKKAISALVKSEALNELMDSRFENLRHFYMCVAFDRPRKEKDLLKNIEEYKGQEDFTEEERIQFLVDLTGIFPIEKVMDDYVLEKLKEKHIPPISEYDSAFKNVWCIPREVVHRKTSRGQDYYFVKVIDSNFVETIVKCWGIDLEYDNIFINKPYGIKNIRWQEDWGFSTMGRINKSWVLLRG